MKAADGNWVKAKILKHIISVYGVYWPDMVATIPERIALNWVKNGIAVVIDEDGNSVELIPGEETTEEEMDESEQEEEAVEEETVEFGLDADTLEDTGDPPPEEELSQEEKSYSEQSPAERRDSMMDELEAKAKAIPDGMFFCSHCQSTHRVNSRKGIKHLKYSQ